MQKLKMTYIVFLSPIFLSMLLGWRLDWDIHWPKVYQRIDRRTWVSLVPVEHLNHGSTQSSLFWEENKYSVHSQYEPSFLLIFKSRKHLGYIYSSYSTEVKLNFNFTPSLQGKCHSIPNPSNFFLIIKHKVSYVTSMYCLGKCLTPSSLLERITSWATNIEYPTICLLQRCICLWKHLKIHRLDMEDISSTALPLNCISLLD